MIACYGCGKEIHESATSCPSCGAVQSQNPTVISSNSETAYASLSETWKQRFQIIDEAGGPKLTNIKSLPFGKRFKINSNILGFLFGPFYYFEKGMPKKALTLTGLSLGLIIIVSLLCELLNTSDAVTNFISAVIFGTRANIDYYKKIMLNDNGWW